LLQSREATVSAGGAGGLPCLRWPSGFCEVLETAGLLLFGGVGPSRSRVRFSTAVSRNKVLSLSFPSWWCSAPVPSTRAWRWDSLRGSLIQESVAGDSSGGEFSGLVFRGWRGSFGLCGRQESGAAGSVVPWWRLSAMASLHPGSPGLRMRPRPMDLQRLLHLVQDGECLLRLFSKPAGNGALVAAVGFR
jgi:hypothetical protein